MGKRLNIQLGDKVGIGDWIHQGEAGKSKGRNRLVKALCAKCNSGKIHIVQLSNLINGHSKSCCGRISPEGEASINVIFTGYRIGAGRRNLEFKLSKNDFLKLINLPCYYCGEPPSNKFNKYTNKNGEINRGLNLSTGIIKRAAIYCNGIDRTDNNLGYTIDNCVNCCLTCNHAKSTMSRDRFLYWIKKVYNHSIKH